MDEYTSSEKRIGKKTRKGRNGSFCEWDATPYTMSLSIQLYTESYPNYLLRTSLPISNKPLIFLINRLNLWYLTSDRVTPPKLQSPSETYRKIYSFIIIMYEVASTGI